MKHLDDAWALLVDAGAEVVRAFEADEIDGPESEELISAVKRIRTRIGAIKKERGQVPLEKAKR